MASDSTSSASTTPMLLTPDSTGGGSPDNSLAVKKARRTTAFYPNLNSSNKPLKPFSRSAAKRESVMGLGSIEHLQHYFTKTGIAAKKNPLDKPHHGLVPAIGGLSHVPTSPSLGSISEFPLPPSPAIPSPPRAAYPPFVKTYETNPESLLPGVVDDLVAVATAWRVDEDLASADALKASFDVLDVLKTTTRAIRSIRNYLLSLPDESAGTIRAQFRPHNLTSRNLAGSAGKGNVASSSGSGSADPLTLIRRSALEVLTVLRELEESCRLPLSDDAYDAGSDGGGPRSPGGVPGNALELPAEDHGALSDASDVGDVSVSFSLVQVGGRYESVPVWEDEDASDVEEEEEKEKRERWDERLVLGSGWLYRQDVGLGELGRERRVVVQYLDVVDEVLFRGTKTEGEKVERGWERERKKVRGRALAAGKRRVSAGDVLEGRRPTLGGDKRRISEGMLSGIVGGMMLSEEPGAMAGIGEEDEGEEDEGLGNDEEVDDEELPEWVKRRKFAGDELARAHALLTAFLPAHLLPALSPPATRADFLGSLSSGQLLCVAYNTCVRKSQKPWGFVSADAIHDIVALEEKAEREGDQGATSRKGWTFRRTDNLRLWAGALKLRYLLPIHTPSQHVKQDNPGTPLGSPGPTAHNFSKASLATPPLIFDAKVVARKDDGWEDMLETVLLQWVQKAVDERRAAS